MQLRLRLPLLLIVGWGLVDVGVLVAFTVLDLAGRVETVVWEPIFLGLVTVQGSAAAAWFYLSDHWPGWHALSLLVLIICLAACGPQPLRMAGIIVAHLLVLALVHYPLGILRDRGWQYRFHLPTIDERSPWQFSLGQLVGVTLVTAFGLGLWQLLGWFDLSQTSPFVRSWALMGLQLAILVWPPAIRVLVGIVRSVYLHIAATALGIIYLQLLTIYYAAYDWRVGAPMLGVTVAGTVIVVLQALALRWAGWRIEHDPPGHLRPRPAPASGAR